MNRNVNLIAVFSADRKKLLFCKRRKNPYKGLFNFVGGKIETGEDGFAAAYRELLEETGIARGDIELVHLMDFLYYLEDTKLEVYFGYLKKELSVQGSENDLFWMDTDSHFFDKKIFAGEGNIGHIVERILKYAGAENVLKTTREVQGRNGNGGVLC